MGSIIKNFSSNYMTKLATIFMLDKQVNKFLYYNNILDEDILTYFEEHKADLTEGEFLIPDVVCNHIAKKDITVKVIDTSSVWYGVTYREDANMVKESLKELIESGSYPQELWN